MYTSGTKNEHGEERLSDIRAAMRSQQMRASGRRVTCSSATTSSADRTAAT